MAKDDKQMAKAFRDKGIEPLHQCEIDVRGSEVGGVSPTGKSFRFVSCVRARGGCRVRSGQKDKVLRDRFPFSLFPPGVFPFSLSSS